MSGASRVFRLGFGPFASMRAAWERSPRVLTTSWALCVYKAANEGERGNAGITPAPAPANAPAFAGARPGAAAVPSLFLAHARMAAKVCSSTFGSTAASYVCSSWEMSVD